jgi:hypothetical protein
MADVFSHVKTQQLRGIAASAFLYLFLVGFSHHDGA